MRYSGRIRGIDSVDIERDVNRRGEFHPHIVPETARLESLDSEALHLLALMRRCRSNTDLNKSVGESLFHDARERRRMRSGVFLKIVINVRMRIEVKQRERGMATVYRSHDRMTDRMITSEADQRTSFVQDFANPCSNHIP